jgi:hypothetical protein
MPSRTTGNNPEKITAMGKINVYHATLVAYYLEKLRSVQDGDGSLLDQVMVFFGSGMGNSNEHDPHDLPLILAGGAAGTLPKGRHVRFKKGVSCPIYTSPCWRSSESLNARWGTVRARLQSEHETNGTRLCDRLRVLDARCCSAG